MSDDEDFYHGIDVIDDDEEDMIWYDDANLGMAVSSVCYMLCY